MNKKLLFICYIFFQSQGLFAQTPDWSSDIASIIYNNCSSCHHEGNIAPFALMSYLDAVNNAFNIQTYVNAKKMPPWPADPEYNHFKDEKVLSDDEISAINDWVNAGMPLGDTLLAPAPPVFNGNVFMPQIDDVVKCPPFQITSNTDVNRTFVMHSNYTETKYITEMQFVPGDYSAVHHAIFFSDTSNESWKEDSLAAGPGFPGAGSGGGSSPYTVQFGGWNPGRDVQKLPGNMGLEIPPGSDFSVAIHYAPNNYGKWDSSKLYIKFSDDPNVRPVYCRRLLHWHLPSLINGPLVIPANTIKTFNEKSDSMITDSSLLGLAPHCHLLGKSWLVYMITAPGDTTHLLQIPQWDFNWQYDYFLTKVIKMPVNAQVWGEAAFDNTTNNPNNPNDPPVTVYPGASTNDEMMSCHFWTLEYQLGDENIILDSAFYGLPTGGLTVANQLGSQVYPNPTSEILHIVADLPEHNISWTLTDAFGNAVRTFHQSKIANGVYYKSVDVSGLHSGIYFLSIQSGDKVSLKKIVITHQR